MQAIFSRPRRKIEANRYPQQKLLIAIRTNRTIASHISTSSECGYRRPFKKKNAGIVRQNVGSETQIASGNINPKNKTGTPKPREKYNRSHKHAFVTDSHPPSAGNPKNEPRAGIAGIVAPLSRIIPFGQIEKISNHKNTRRSQRKKEFNFATDKQSDGH
jgi:hypothetical protein